MPFTRTPTPRELRQDVLLAGILLVGGILSAALSSIAKVYGSEQAALWTAVPYVVVISAALAVRRRWPAVVAIVVSLAFVAATSLRVPEIYAGNIAMFIALYTVGAWMNNRRAAFLVRAGIMLVMAAWLVIEMYRQAVEQASKAHVVAGAFSPLVAFLMLQVLLNVLYFGGAYYFGERSWSAAAQRAALEQRTAELERERELSAAQAVALDRVRIARELHDVVAHHVSVMGVQAGVARMMIARDPEAATGVVAGIETAARDAIRDFHQLLDTLRAPGDDDAASTVGVDDIAGLVDASCAAGLPARLHVVGEPLPGPAGHRRQPVPDRSGGAHERTSARRTRRGGGRADPVRSRAGRARHGGARGRQLGPDRARPAPRSRPARHARARHRLGRNDRIRPPRDRRLPRAHHDARRGGDRVSGGIRVLVIDDHAMLRAGFRTILDMQPGITVVGEAATGREAVELAGSLLPDVITMDVQMPDMDGLEATRRIRADERIRAAVAIVTTFDRDDYLFEALDAGASGFLLKNAGPEELVAAVRALAAGDGMLAPEVTRRVLQRFASAAATEPPAPVPEPTSPVPEPVEGTWREGASTGSAAGPATLPSAALPEPLTERESEVLRLVAEAWSNAEIAAELYIGEATVKTHVSRILQKLGARDRVQAVVLAHRLGLA